MHLGAGRRPHETHPDDWYYTSKASQNAMLHYQLGSICTYVRTYRMFAQTKRMQRFSLTFQ